MMEREREVLRELLLEKVKFGARKEEESVIKRHESHSGNSKTYLHGKSAPAAAGKKTPFFLDPPSSIAKRS